MYIYIHIYGDYTYTHIFFLIIIYILSFYTIIAFPCYYWCHYTHQIHLDAVVPCHLVYVFWLISNESLFNLWFVHRYGWDSNFQFWTMLGSPKTEHTYSKMVISNRVISNRNLSFLGNYVPQLLLIFSPYHTEMHSLHRFSVLYTRFVERAGNAGVQPWTLYPSEICHG